MPHGHASRTIRVVDATGANERVLTNSRRDQAPSFSPDGTKIVFESWRSGGSQIYTMNADGSAQTQLTSSAGYHSSGDFSPNGKQIAWFHGPTYDDADLWVMNADGSEARRLISNPGADTYPSWSPDGKRIVFTSHRDGNTELYLLDLATNAQTRLTTHAGADDHARWSPDGRKIAFMSWRDGENGIYILDLASRAVQVVPVPQSNAHLPGWSPDGEWLLYHSRTSEGTELFRVRASTACTPATTAPVGVAALTRITHSGANETQPSAARDGLHLAYVTDASNDDWGDEAIYLHALASGAAGRMRRSSADARPDWSGARGELLFVTSTRDDQPQICSTQTDGRKTVCYAIVPALRGTPRRSPDGAQILFSAARADGVATLFLLDAATRQQRELDTGGDATNPSWSADGSRIVFSSARGGNRDLYTIAAAGGEARPLVTGPAADDLPVFSPDRKWLAFVSESGGNWEVFVAAADGTGRRNVSNNPALDTQPAWSADGKSLFFASKRDGNMNIYAVPATEDKAKSFR